MSEVIGGQTTVEEQIAASESEAELAFGGGDSAAAAGGCLCEGDEHICQGNAFGEAAAPVVEIEIPEGMTPEQFEQFKRDFAEQHGVELPADLAPDAFEKLSDDELAAMATPPVEINLPMQNLVLAGAGIRVVKDEESGERAIVVGPIAFNVIVPMDAEAARNVSRSLTGGIEIASGLPAKGVVLS